MEILGLLIYFFPKACLYFAIGLAVLHILVAAYDKLTEKGEAK